MKLISILLATLAPEALTWAKELWSSSPGAGSGQWNDPGYIMKTSFLVGNGKLGAIPFGPPGEEKINLNVDSLWSGGPFELSGYQGGNPNSSLASNLPSIRSFIFENGTGPMDQLLGNGKGYGFYRVLGNLTVSFDGDKQYTGYRRSLDLTTGLHKTSYVHTATKSKVTSTVFCSFPDQVCVYHIESNGTIPKVTIGLENQLVAASLHQTTCEDGTLKHTGVTQLGPPEGLRYAVTVKKIGKNNGASECSGPSLVLTPQGKSLTFVWSAETNYDQKKGNAASGWTFKGEDPRDKTLATATEAASKSYCSIKRKHVADFKALTGAFTLELGDPHGSAQRETPDLFTTYSSNGTGDPFMDNILFDMSRYLLISSSRENSLPANLQGRWTEQLKPSWSSDYHSNINLQMNYWAADQTGLAATQKGLWDYMEDTWVPRGTETARLLYNATGWVVHNEINIFGHSAMKEKALWANYPAAGAWMMQHVWDAFEYTQDVDWLKRQGYPLLKGVAQYYLSTLQEDQFTKDGTLVVNPCNSPEHGPTTFGCTHDQQLIYQVLDTTLSAAKIVSEPDNAFIEAVSSSLSRLDKGLHFTSWGGLKEWKVPESYGLDVPNFHRHMAMLTGWFPGYAVSSYQNGYSNSTIQEAVRQTLISRGRGNDGDGNSGWAKTWRSACWARLNDTTRAYDHMKYAIEQNFVGSALSMYKGREPPLQLDANFAFGGAVLSVLVNDMSYAHDFSGQRTVVLGPAIPWPTGSVRGLRLRGGAVVDFAWENGEVKDVEVVAKTHDGGVKIVNAKGNLLAEV